MKAGRVFLIHALDRRGGDYRLTTDSKIAKAQNDFEALSEIDPN